MPGVALAEVDADELELRPLEALDDRQREPSRHRLDCVLEVAGEVADVVDPAEHRGLRVSHDRTTGFVGSPDTGPGAQHGNT